MPSYGTALYKLQKAMYEALVDDTTLRQMGVKVFDYVTTEETFPYIVFQSPSELQFNTFDRFGSEVDFNLHIWSRYDGWKECYEILDRLNTILHYQQIPIDGLHLVYLRSENVNSQIDLNLEIRQLIVTYNALLLQA